MKLYYAPGACSLSPHIVACEAELPIELIKVNLQSKRTEANEDFLQINPNGYVPALVLDDGNKLTEGPAIVQYLADQVPEKHLVPPAGSFERYRLQQWLNFISTELHKSFSPLFNPSVPEEVKQWAKNLLTKRLDTTAQHLESQPFLLGENFTVADAYLFVILSWRKHVGLETPPRPALDQYADKIAARPAVQKAMSEEGLI